jgi:CheY-like chemotaxis protein
MNILIVEDDKYKADAIQDCLNDYLDFPQITTEDSLSSGLFSLMDSPNLDLIILDMSMPSFDISEKDPSGGTPESYAGEDFLSQMTLLDINLPVIVVTQYDNFGSDEKQISLLKLSDKLQHDHPKIFKGSIYFKATSNSWKQELIDLMKSQGIK